MRLSFQSTLPGLNVSDLVFIDETGTNTSMTLSHARSPKGDRAHAKVPAKQSKNLTTIGSLNKDGISSLMTIEGATTGEVFLGYVEEFLAPTLKENQVVIMDNLSSHKVKNVREAIEAKGASLLYLPPYSPDYNPIEMCWSKMKQKLRKIGARTKDNLQNAIAEAANSVTPENASNWIKHCGYVLSN